MPSSSSAGARGLPSLAQRLLWITLFRTVATTLLLVVLASRLLSAPVEALPPDASRGFAIIGLVYLASLAYALFLRTGRAQTGFAYVQILGDVALAGVLSAFSGGLESPFAFVFLLAVLAGAVLLGRRGAVMAAAVSSVVLLARALVAGSELRASEASGERMLFLLLSNLLALFLIAWLASYLSDQLARTYGRLNEREADFAALAKLQDQILTSMPSGLVTCGLDGKVTYLNRAAAGILGISAAEGHGRELESLVPGVSRIPAGSLRNELHVPTPAGERILGLSVTGLDMPASGSLLVFQDLTLLRHAEEDLRRSDRLAALGQLSAQLAHEIRNPLAAMRGAAQLLANEAGGAGPSAKLTAILIRESDRLGALVEDFLRFARPAQPQLRPVQLDGLVRQVLEMLATDPLMQHVRVLSELESLTFPVDSDQMQQVLINLLRNACAAVGAGGRVRLTVQQLEGRACVRVWDSAGAISAEDLPRVFEPFFSKRAGGTGLGLSTAHSIIRAHGGSIRVSSSASAGTEFVIELPDERARMGEDDPDRR